MDGPFEPDDAAPRWVLALAAAIAVGAAVLAPVPWPAGEGLVVVDHRTGPVASMPVTVGSGAEVVVEGSTDDVDVLVVLTGGVRSDAEVVATIEVAANGRPVAADLDDVVLTLELSDGRSELIPVLRRDGDVLVAQRRPPVGAAAVLGLLGAVVVLWMSEAFPLHITSLAIPVVLVASGTSGAADALAPFFHPIIALFFAGFLMAEAMRRSALDHLAAISIVARAGRSPVTLFAAMLGVAAFLSMWMSNTAAVAVLIPIALAVTEPLDAPAYRKAVVLGIAYAATIGGVGSAIGTPANPLAIAFLEDYVGRSISFAEWFGFGLPMVVLFLPVIGWYLWRRLQASPPTARFDEAREVSRRELAGLGRLTRDQSIVLAVFAIVMAGWLTQPVHGLETGIVALAGAVALGMLRRIRPEDLGRISWSSLLTFGGGLALGFALVESGTADWLATRLEGLGAVPSGVAIAAVGAFALALTTVASNTAAAAMLVPLAIPLGGIVGVDPVLTVIVVAVASSIDFALVIGTPPTMLAYSTRLFTPMEIFRTGIVLDLAGVALLVTAVVGIWRLLGLV